MLAMACASTVSSSSATRDATVEAAPADSGVPDAPPRARLR